MKLKHLIPTALAAFVAIAAPVAQAAYSYSPGDLLLGFRSTQTGFTANDFVVNIGSGPSYAAALSPITLTLSNLTTTLDSIFGTNWATNSNVKWGIFGTSTNEGGSGDFPRVLYSSEPVGNNAPTGLSNQASGNTQITGVKNYYQGLTESAVNNGSIGSTANTFSWTTQVLGGFGNPAGVGPVEGVITTNLELYRIPQTNHPVPTVTDEGTFSLSGNTLTFTPVPEASTYAFWFMGAAGLVVVSFRYLRKPTNAKQS